MALKGLPDALFAVAEFDADAVFLVEVLGQMLGGIDAAMLAARAAEREHETGESALDVSLYVGIGQSVHGFEES